MDKAKEVEIAEALMKAIDENNFFDVAILAKENNLNLHIISPNKNGLTCLEYAAQRGHWLCVEALIDHNKSNDCYRDLYGRLLIHAIKQNRAVQVRRLLDKQASIHAVDNAGHTCLQLALKSRNKDIIEWVLTAGACLNLSMEEKAENVAINLDELDYLCRDEFYSHHSILKSAIQLYDHNKKIQEFAGQLIHKCNRLMFNKHSQESTAFLTDLKKALEEKATAARFEEIVDHFIGINHQKKEKSKTYTALVSSDLMKHIREYPSQTRKNKAVLLGKLS